MGRLCGESVRAFKRNDQKDSRDTSSHFGEKAGVWICTAAA